MGDLLLLKSRDMARRWFPPKRATLRSYRSSPSSRRVSSGFPNDPPAVPKKFDQRLQEGSPWSVLQYYLTRLVIAMKLSPRSFWLFPWLSVCPWCPLFDLTLSGLSFGNGLEEAFHRLIADELVGFIDHDLGHTGNPVFVGKKIARKISYFKLKFWGSGWILWITVKFSGRVDFRYWRMS